MDSTKEQSDTRGDSQCVSTDSPTASENEPNHASGPWRVAQWDGDEQELVVLDDDEPGLAIIATIEDGQFDSKFNARLIAASPDFYAAAVSVMAAHDAEAVRCNFTTCGCDYCKALRPVVAKAEGR